MKDSKLTHGEGATLLLKDEGARQEMAATQSYLQRGRAFKDLTDEHLRERWVETVREWVKRGVRDRPVSNEDAEAELRLRGLKTPDNMAQQELSTLVAETDAAFKRMTREQVGEMGAELASRYVKQREQEN